SRSRRALFRFAPSVRGAFVDGRRAGARPSHRRAFRRSDGKKAIVLQFGQRTRARREHSLAPLPTRTRPLDGRGHLVGCARMRKLLFVVAILVVLAGAAAAAAFVWAEDA